MWRRETGEFKEEEVAAADRETAESKKSHMVMMFPLMTTLEFLLIDAIYFASTLAFHNLELSWWENCDFIGRSKQTIQHICTKKY